MTEGANLHHFCCITMSFFLLKLPFILVQDVATNQHELIHKAHEKVKVPSKHDIKDIDSCTVHLFFKS